MQANLRITELEAKLAGLQKELAVLQKQDKRTPINQGNSFNFSDSESEATSSRSSQKRKKGQAFPPSISYGGFFPNETGMSVLVVGPQATPLMGHPPMKCDPPILITGMLPRPLRKTQAGGNTWQYMCALDSPEFKDTLLIARAKKGSECTPEEHTILLHALKHKKAQACALKPAPFVILSGIAKELTSMMQPWLMNEAACPQLSGKNLTTL